jgi:hypothetical protein
MGQRLSAFITDAALAATLAAAENGFFAGEPPSPAETQDAPLSWSAQDLSAAFGAAGFAVETAAIEHTEERVIGASDLSLWFDGGKSPWGRYMQAQLGNDDFTRIKACLGERAQTGPLLWQWQSVLVKARLLP